jgi:hypothetical protein
LTENRLPDSRLQTLAKLRLRKTPTKTSPWPRLHFMIVESPSSGFSNSSSFFYGKYYSRSRVSSGGIVSDYGLDDRASGVRFPVGQRIFPLSSVSRPALRPTQPPVQLVPGVLSPGVKRGRGVMLTTHPHLVPRSRMSRSYTSSPPSASMACSRTALPLNIIPPCIPGTLHIQVSSAAAVVVQKHSLIPST